MKYSKEAGRPFRVEEPAAVGAFQAKTELSRLLREARAGKPGKWGDMEGKIRVADDFCEEIEAFNGLAAAIAPGV